MTWLAKHYLQALIKNNSDKVIKRWNNKGLMGLIWIEHQALATWNTDQFSIA